MTPSVFLHRIQPEQIPSDSFSSLDASDTDSERCAYFGEVKPQPFVRLKPEAVSALSDIELQNYILRCAEQFLAAQKRWEETGCFAAIGDRDGWWRSEADALVERGHRQGVTRA